MTKFLVNKSAGNVSLLEGRIYISQGGYAEVPDDVLDHLDIIDAKKRGWIVVDGEAPTETVEIPTITLENDKLKGSLTPPKQEPVVEAAPEPVAESVAEPVVVEETSSEEAPKSGKAKK